METEKITASPSDNKVYMHTEEEMEAIIEGIILMEMAHEIMKKRELGVLMRTLVAGSLDYIFDRLIKKLAGDDADKTIEKIRARHKKEMEAMDPMDILKGLN